MLDNRLILTRDSGYIINNLLNSLGEQNGRLPQHFSSPLVRRVSGRVKNVTGRYPSPKMGEVELILRLEI